MEKLSEVSAGIAEQTVPTAIIVWGNESQSHLEAYVEYLRGEGKVKSHTAVKLKEEVMLNSFPPDGSALLVGILLSRDRIKFTICFGSQMDPLEWED